MRQAFQSSLGRVSRSMVVLAGLVLLQACVSTGPSKNNKDAAQYNAQLGADYLLKNELRTARDLLEKALEQDKRNALAHVTYGQLQYRIEDYDKAAVHFKRAIELEPDEANHRNNYGVFLCQTEQYEAAEKQFQLASENKFYKTPEFALDNAGVCMLEADNLEKADEYLRAALRINPTFANSYLHMAELLHRRDRLTVADAYYQSFKSRGNQTPESLLLGVELYRDRGNPQLAEQYASQLLDQYPTSREAGEYLARPLN